MEAESCPGSMLVAIRHKANAVRGSLFVADKADCKAVAAIVARAVATCEVVADSANTTAMYDASFGEDCLCRMIPACAVDQDSAEGHCKQDVAEVAAA